MGIKTKKTKFTFKIIAVALIQAFLVMDFAFCGANEVFAKERKNFVSTLAPKINIDSDELQKSILYLIQNPAQGKGLEETAKVFQPEKQKKGFTRRESFGLIALLPLAAFSVLNAPTDSFAQEKRNIIDEPYDLVVNLGKKINDKNILKIYKEIIEKYVKEEEYEPIPEDGTIMIKIGSSKADAKTLEAQLNRELRRRGLKNFVSQPSAIIWEKTPIFKTMQKFVNDIADVSGTANVGKIDKELLKEAVEAITFVETRFKHRRINKYGEIELTTSKTGAVGITQLILNEAVQDIVYWVFGGKEHGDNNKIGGYIKFNQMIKALHKSGKKYLAPYLEAKNNEEKIRAVQNLVRTMVEDKILVEKEEVYLNIYYALAIWQKLNKLDNEAIEDIVKIIEEKNIQVEAPGIGYKPKSFRDAQLQFDSDYFKNEVIGKIIGEGEIIRINKNHKTVKSKQDELMKRLKNRITNVKEYKSMRENQRIGYLYFLFLWDKARRIRLVKNEARPGYSLNKESLEDFEKNIEHGFDVNLVAAAGYNSGWSTVEAALKRHGKDWYKYIAGANKNNPEETKGYVRKYLEFLAQYKGTITKTRSKIMSYLIADYYQRFKKENRVFNEKLAVELAKTSGTEYVDRYILSYGLTKWEDKILAALGKEKIDDVKGYIRRANQTVKMGKREDSRQKLTSFAKMFGLSAASILVGGGLGFIIYRRIKLGIAQQPKKSTSTKKQSVPSRRPYQSDIKRVNRLNAKISSLKTPRVSFWNKALNTIFRTGRIGRNRFFSLALVPLLADLLLSETASAVGGISSIVAGASILNFLLVPLVIGIAVFIILRIKDSFFPVFKAMVESKINEELKDKVFPEAKKINFTALDKEAQENAIKEVAFNAFKAQAEITGPTVQETVLAPEQPKAEIPLLAQDIKIISLPDKINAIYSQEERLQQNMFNNNVIEQAI